LQFLTSLFGGFENSLVTAALALGVVLVLIVLGLWVLKVFFRASTNLSRGRNRRINVVDSVMLDPRRQLFIVRRDNVEHLILTGGPQDLVVESGIAVEKPAGPAARRPVLPSVPAAPAATAAPTEQRPVSSHPVTDALEAAQSLVHGRDAVTAGPTTGPMERLRELARPVGRQGPSLRQTGLMRPVSRMEPAAVIPINPDAAEHRRFDSAKAGPSHDGNGQRFGAGVYPADGYKAEGN
jgi:flagellar protein FliO/FliZ